VGADYFLDHVHPTIEGNRILALALLDVIVEEGLAERSSSWDSAAIESVTRTVEARTDERAHGVALRNLAKVLSWAGKTAEAARLAARAVQRLGPDPESLFIAASFDMEVGRLEEAAEKLRAALVRDPEYVKAHTNLGVTLARSGQLEEALLHYDEALRLDPAHANALYNRGRLRSRRGELDAAIEDFRGALRLEPEDEDARFNLASSLSRTGDTAAAAAEFARVVELNPADAEARLRMGEALRELERGAAQGEAVDP